MITGLGNVIAELQKLNENFNKTEYEKAREPLQEELRLAHKEIFVLKEKLRLMQETFRLIITNIKADYITVVVDTSIPEARFFTGKDDFKNIDYTTVKTIQVPIKDNLMSDIGRIYNQIEMENEHNGNN